MLTSGAVAVLLAHAACRAPAPARPPSRMVAPASRPAPLPSPSPPLDLSRDVLATLVLPSVRDGLRRLSGHLQPHLPVQSPLRGFVEPAALATRFFAALRLPGLLRALDLGRPLAIAVVHDATTRKVRIERQTLIALPVRDPQRLVAQLASRFEGQRQRGAIWELQRFGTTRLWVQFVSGWALLAPSARFARAAPAVLLPLVQRRGGGQARLTLWIQRTRQRFPRELDQVLSRLRGPARSGRRRALLAALGLDVPEPRRAVAALLADAAKVTLRLELGARLLVLHGALTTRGGALAEWAALRHDAPWGLAGLAESTSLLLQRHSSAAFRGRVIATRFAAASPPLGARAAWSALREAALTLASQLGAELHAVSAPREGGLGLLSLSATRGDGEAAQRSVAALFAALARHAPTTLAALLAHDPRLPAAPLAGVRLRWRRGAVRAAMARGDVLELRWPRGRAGRAPGPLLRRWQALLGPRPCLGYLLLPLPSGGRGLALAAGSACRSRLLATARRLAGGGGKLAEQLRPLLGSQRPAWLLWASLAQLIDQALPIIAAARDLPPQLGAMVRQLLPPVSVQKSMPLLACAAAERGVLRARLALSTDVMEFVTRGLTLLYSVGSYGAPRPPPSPRVP